MEKILAVLTKDAAFGHTLAEYITNSHVLKYKILTFYDVADYMQFKDSNKIEVLLADEAISQEQYATSEDKIFLLTEEKRNESNTIFKYQSMEITVRELSFKLHADKRGALPENHSFKIKSVISAKGGSGVTSFSLALAGVFGKTQSTLLISLDPFVTMPLDFEKNDGELSELIYNLKLGNAYLAESPGGCLRHSRDFDYIAGVLSFEDLNFFGNEEMRSFLAGLSGDGRYKTVIFDLGRLPPCTGVILEKSEMVYVIGEESGEEGSNMQKQLRALLGEAVSSKIKMIELPIVEQFRNGIPAYLDFEHTELIEFTEKLIKAENHSLINNITYADSFEELHDSKILPAPEAAVCESAKSYATGRRGLLDFIGMKPK